MVELYILGPAEIRNAEGALEQSFLAGPKRLALLVYLLLDRPRGFHRRDRLLPLFWPEHGQKSARNALSNMLYHIRRTLGGEAITNRGTEEVKIRPESFWSDALAFEQAIQDEDYQSALSLYRSDLLKGFHLTDASAEFDYWLEQERNRFRSLATAGSWALAEKAFSKYDHQAAKAFAKKAAELNPLSEQVHMKLIRFLDRSGDRQSALEAYQSFANLIWKEFEEEPGLELTNLVNVIKSRSPSVPEYSAPKVSFHIQEKTTKDILETLKVQLTTKVKQNGGQHPSIDLNAYRMYTQGRNSLEQRTESGIYQGLDCFQGSIELDPDYALAWAGLADALSLLHFYGFSIPKNSPDPLTAATRSVSINKDLGEAHASLGIAHSIHQQGAEALRELELAVKLTPGYTEALVWLGWINLVLGRPRKALEPARLGVSLHPLAPAFRVFLAEIFLANGANEEALFEAKRAREINPEYGLTHFMEGLALYHIGKLEEAVVAFQKALSLVPAMGTPSQAEIKTALAFTYYALGNIKESSIIKQQTYGRINPFSLALLHSLFGELDEAFDAFSCVKDWGSFSTEQIRYFFPVALAPLRKDKRFQNLIAHVNQAWGLLADGSLP